MKNLRSSKKIDRKRVGAGVAVATLLLSLLIPQGVGLWTVISEPVTDIVCSVACDEDLDESFSPKTGVTTCRG